MKSTARLVSVVGLLMVSTCVANGEPRIWTSAGGQHTIEAEFAGIRDGVLTLKRTDGKTVDVPIGKLSEADQKIARELAAAAPAEPTREEINAVIEKLGGRFDNGGRRLFLSGTRVTDAGLAHIEGLAGLGTLQISGCPQITDAGLAHLKGLTGLETLSLDGSKITDAGLAHLGEMPSLKRLDLRSTGITDAGLPQLKGLTSLERLVLDDTRVTDAGVAKLEDLLPKCLITPQPIPLGADAHDKVRSEVLALLGKMADIISSATDLPTAKAAAGELAKLDLSMNKLAVRLHTLGPPNPALEKELEAKFKPKVEAVMGRIFKAISALADEPEASAIMQSALMKIGNMMEGF